MGRTQPRNRRFHGRSVVTVSYPVVLSGHFLPSVCTGLIISLQLLRGDMEQVRRENPLIFSRGVAITRKLGFPDVIMPGESTHSGPIAEPSSLEQRQEVEGRL